MNARRTHQRPQRAAAALLLLVLSAVPVALVACNASPTGSSGTAPVDSTAASAECGPLPYFTVLPVPAANIAWVDVIGRLGAPSQTLPKGHTGAMLNTMGTPVVAPGNITIDRLRRVRYLASPFREGEEDYAIFFRVCKDVTGHFGHVITLDGSTFPADIPWSNCQTGSTSDETIESCEIDGGGMAVSAGQPLGTAAGMVGMALDMGLIDERVSPFFASPGRYPGNFKHYVCPFEYYDEAGQSAFFSKLFDPANPGPPPPGTVEPRLPKPADPSNPLPGEEPRCGTLEVDVAGTAQGVWAETAAPLSVASEQHRFITLANNPYRPQTELALSLGPDALGAGVFRAPRQTSGRVNLAFDQVTGDGVIHCYFPSGLSGPGSQQDASWFIALQANGSLKIERVAHGEGSSPCSAEPSTWAFGGNAMVMVR
jgi:hypothetical protein